MTLYIYNMVSRDEQTFLLEGKRYGKANLAELERLAERRGPFWQDLCAFLAEWYAESPTVLVHTSGSTGTPKPFLAKKEQMENSARLTCDVLGLEAGDRALLCMPLRYIAGKMVVVRALVRGLELVLREPSGHPFATDLPALKFAALVPLQVYDTLRVPAEAERLAQTTCLIIGGGSIDPELEQALATLPVKAYSTYGMTETLSHIALRRLNGAEASPWYRPFPTVSLRLSGEGTLIIQAPQVADAELLCQLCLRKVLDSSFFCDISSDLFLIHHGHLAFIFIVMRILSFSYYLMVEFEDSSCQFVKIASVTGHMKNILLACCHDR